MNTAWDYLAAYILLAAVAVGVISMLVGWVAEHLPERRATRVMSRPTRRPRKLRRASVYIPVWHTDGISGGMENPKPALPDIDAPKAGMVQISLDIKDNDLIAVLTMLRKDGKPRYSANEIHKIVGGDRNTVLARVKEIRSTPAAPVYRPLTEDKKPVAA